MLHIDSKYIKLVSARLRNFKQKDANLWNFSCPICGDSQKNKLKARGYVYKKGNGLYYRCHNCGVGTNLANLIKHVDPAVYREYTLEKYKSGHTGERYAPEAFDVPTTRFGKIDRAKSFDHAEWVEKLPSGHFCLEYVTKRKIPSRFYDRLLFTSTYKKFCDSLIPNHGKKIIDDARLIIPFYDEHNELIAVSGRALESSEEKIRYVTLRTNDSNHKLIFGMERLDLNQPVKIVEGPIDSLFLKNCVASCDSNLSVTAKNISCERKLLIFDNEPRNKEIVKLMQDAINLDHNVVIWPDKIAAKDINEMVMSGISPDEIENIISSNTFKGLEAQTKFIFWKKL
jgi:hypothetical protein